MEKEKVYLLCDGYKGNVYCGAANIGIEYMGDCWGRIVKEDGTLIGSHYSSSFGWLRSDLLNKLDNPENYEVIDFLHFVVPEKFKLTNNETTNIPNK